MTALERTLRLTAEVLDQHGIERARKASRMIMQRGFHRERDLAADLENCLQQVSES